ncbi:MAG: hypothetical protein KIH08_16505, partial [Candidatus Freyarchaeota archaeon]|nr:hypothetical protein [Candidatus Jordarchaeia archaeon]
VASLVVVCCCGFLVGIFWGVLVGGFGGLLVVVFLVFGCFFPKDLYYFFLYFVLKFLIYCV